MTIAKRFPPISYLKTNTADVAKELADHAGPIAITRNGAPSFVCIDFDDYNQMQETNALVKLVTMGEREIQRGEYKPLAEAKADLDNRILERLASKSAKT